MSSTHSPTSNIATVSVGLIFNNPALVERILEEVSSTMPHGPSLLDSFIEKDLIPVQYVPGSCNGPLQVVFNADNTHSLSLDIDLEYAFPPDMALETIAEKLQELDLSSSFTETSFKFRGIELTEGIEPKYGILPNKVEDGDFIFKQVFDENGELTMASFTVHAESITGAWARMTNADPDEVSIKETKPSAIELELYHQLSLTSITGQAGIILKSINSSLDCNGDVRNLQDPSGITNTYFHEVGLEDIKFLSQIDKESSSTFLRVNYLNSKISLTTKLEP